MNVDWTINIGDLFAVAAFLATATAAYFRLDKQIALVRQQVEMVEEKVAEVKTDTREMKRRLFKEV